MKTFKLLILATLIAQSTAWAQQGSDKTDLPSPFTIATYQAGVGTTNLLDTYLSQSKFEGTGITLLSTSEIVHPEKHWRTLTEHQVNLSSVEDNSGLREELQGDYTFFYGRLRHWQLTDSWTVQAGAMAAANIGFIYNTSNSNNPAQARVSLNVMPTATASKDFRLLRRNWNLRYELNLPLLGVMFSPNYGQSYYEIFSLGNYDHNVVPTTFIAAPSLRQQFAVSCDLWRHTTLQVGYLGDYQQAHVNNLKSHVYSHRLMLGLVMRFARVQIPRK